MNNLNKLNYIVLRTVIILLLFGGVSINLAFAANPDKVCFPPHIGLPYTWQPPTVDGLVEQELGRSLLTPLPANTLPLVETGWTSAPRISYAAGGAEPNVSFQSLKHASDNYIYLNFMVHYDPTFDDEDAIVLVLRPNYYNSPNVPVSTKLASERRIDIKPVRGGIGANQLMAGGTPYLDPNDDNCVASGSEVSCSALGVDKNTAKLRTNRNPQSVTYYRWDTAGSGSWQPITPTSAGSGNDIKAAEFTDNIKVRSWDAGANNKNWFVEIRIPTTKAKGGNGWIDLQNSFGMYFNVLRVCTALPCATPLPGDPSTVGTNLVAEYTWPRADYATGNGLIDDPTMTKSLDQFRIEPSWFGEALLSGGTSDCRGVHFAAGHSSIGLTANASDTTTPLSTTISKTGNNIFAARVINDGSSMAQNVNAEFLIAGWGSQNPSVGYWDKIPATTLGKPNPTAFSTIGAGATYQYTMDWDPTQPGAQPSWFGNVAKHNCVAVRLNSTSDVYFSESQYWNNLNFEGLSEKTNNAFIRANGYGPSAKGGTLQDFLFISSAQTIYSGNKYLGWQNGKVNPVEFGQPDQVNQYLLKARADIKARNVDNCEINCQQIMPPLDPLAANIYDRWTNAKTPTSSTLWIVNGYRYSPLRLKLGSLKLQVAESTTSFGLVGEHDGPTNEFKNTLSGGEITPIGKDNNAWRIQVENGKQKTISTTISASSTPPKPPCQCGTICAKQAKNESDSITGSLVMVGSLGIGGLAFFRRKRKQNNDVTGERTED